MGCQDKGRVEFPVPNNNSKLLSLVIVGIANSEVTGCATLSKVGRANSSRIPTDW